MEKAYNKRAPQPDVSMRTLVDFMDMIEKPKGLHTWTFAIAGCLDLWEVMFQLRSQRIL